MIYEHHSRHGNGSFAKAVDVGAGVGIFAKELTARFEHVVVSDSASHYVESAEAFLSQVVPNSEDRLSFITSPAEDLSGVEAESSDLVTIAEAIHWTDNDEAVRASTRILRSGGTLAIILYGIRPFFLDPAEVEAQAALDALFDKYFDNLLSDVRGAAAPTQKSNSKMDSINFNVKFWLPPVYRRHWSRERTMTAARYEPLPTSIGPEDVVETLEGSLMTEDVDFSWIEGYFRNLYQDKNRMEALRNELNRLGAVLGQQRKRLAWPVSVVLATKR